MILILNYLLKKENMNHQRIFKSYSRIQRVLIKFERKRSLVDKTPKGFPLTDLKKLPISFSGKSAESFKVNNLSYQVTEDLGASASDTNNKHTIFSLKKKFQTTRREDLTILQYP